MKAAKPKPQPKLKPTSPVIGDLPDVRTAGIDPLQVNARLYMQISELLNQLETMSGLTIRERVAALTAIGRVQVLFVGLRKEKIDYGPGAGSAVRKYATAFSKDDPGRRKAIAGPKPAADPEPEDWFERAALADDDDPD